MDEDAGETEKDEEEEEWGRGLFRVIYCTGTGILDTKVYDFHHFVHDGAG